MRRVLLHEMCHIGAPNHGKKWQSIMMRLADMGETWAKNEVEDSDTWNQEMGNLRDSLDELARVRPRQRLVSLMSGISKEYGFTYQEFKKKV